MLWGTDPRHFAFAERRDGTLELTKTRPVSYHLSFCLVSSCFQVPHTHASGRTQRNERRACIQHRTYVEHFIFCARTAWPFERRADQEDPAVNGRSWEGGACLVYGDLCLSISWVSMHKVTVVNRDSTVDLVCIPATTHADACHIVSISGSTLSPCLVLSGIKLGPSPEACL